MLGWISRLFNREQGNGKAGTGSAAQVLFRALSRRSARHESSWREPAAEKDAPFQRLEVPFDPSLRIQEPEPDPDYEEKRTPREDRRSGEERRNGIAERRVRDIPVKKERRRKIWDRRRKFGERRFNPTRRREPKKEYRKVPDVVDAPAAVSVEYNVAYDTVNQHGMAILPPPVPIVDEVPLQEMAPPPPPPPAPEPGKLPLVDSRGAVVAYVRYDDGQHNREIDILEHDSGEERTVDFTQVDGKLHFRCGAKDHTLDFPARWSPEEPLTITPYGNVTLLLSRAVEGYIVLAAEKRTVNLFQAVRKRPATTTVLLGDTGAEVERLGPLTCRFGRVRLYFDLTQVVEILDSSGRTWRISGPSGVTNFEEYRKEPR